MTTSLVTGDQILDILRLGLPAGHAMAPKVTHLAHGEATLEVQAGPADARPGGTVAGPFLFGLADLAVFAAVLTSIGPEALAVTTDATMHFLRKPSLGVLVARARLLKGGQRLVVGEVLITPGGAPESEAVAHAVMTYSVPPVRPGRGTGQ